MGPGFLGRLRLRQASPGGCGGSTGPLGGVKLGCAVLVSDSPFDLPVEVLFKELLDVLYLLEEYFRARQQCSERGKDLRLRLHRVVSALKALPPARRAPPGAAARPVRPPSYEAWRLEFDINTDGSYTVRIDNELPFRMPRALADFLKFLASGEPSPTDGLPMWRSRDSMLRWLCKYSDREFDSAYPKKRVWKLRSVLRDVGITRRLVLSDPDLGARFAIRRDP